MLLRRARACTHVTSMHVTSSQGQLALVLSILSRRHVVGLVAMTVRVQSLGGASVAGWVEYLADKLKVEEARSVEARQAVREGGASSEMAQYYGQSQKSFWHGAGAARLGLSGHPERAELEALFEGVDPASGERLGYKFGDKSVRGFDATFAVQKEVSVLWAASDMATRLVIEEAVVEAAKAVLDDVVGVRATTRTSKGPNGEKLSADGSAVVVGAEGPAVAVIPEFTSRAGDPHMHIHSVISSKVWEPATERWLALDARELKLDQRALSGAFHVGLEAELSARLGVAWGGREYAYARTIDGIGPSVVESLSQRGAQTDEAFGEKLERFKEANGYEPSPQQLYRMEREAQRESRAGKEREKLEFDSWQATIGEAAGVPADVLARSVLGRKPEPSEFTDVERMNQALRDLVESQSSFTRGDLFAKLSQFQHVGAGRETAAEAVAVLNVQTDRVLEAVGIEVTPDSTDQPVRRFTTEGVLREEVQVLEHIDQATRSYVEPNATVGGFAPDFLDSLQVQAAARAASTSRFEAIIGLAGAGKTTMLRTAAQTLESEGRESFGLTTSAGAAKVLHEEAGITSENISKFLFEHARPDGPRSGFQLPAGTTLFVDEAGMVGTPHWARLTELSQIHDWRIVAVGDPYQFAAVGRGGVFEHLMATMPEHRISRLEQVHRFNNDWEGPASALIRKGEVTALDKYFEHQRIEVVQPGEEFDVYRQSAHRYMRAREAGQDAAMFAGSNETVSQLNQTVQQIRLARGELGDQVALDGGLVLYVGDEVETRRNDRQLVTDTGEFVKNRDRWTITGQTKAGVVLEGENGSITVPLEYAKNFVQLSYAQTGHASQGRNVDAAISVYRPTDSLIDRAGFYVPMTRGRETNIMYVEADNHGTARTLLEEAIGRRWVDAPALSETPGASLEDQATTGRALVDNHSPADLEAPPTLFDDPPPRPAAEPEPVRIEVNPEVVTAARVRYVLGRVSEAREQIASAPALIEMTRYDLDRMMSDRAGLVSERANLQERLDVHDANRPKRRGLKQWEADRDQLTGRIETVDLQINQLDENARTGEQNIGAYETWIEHGPVELAAREAVLADDRQQIGSLLHNDQEVLTRIGRPPTNPDALRAWRSAAGAIGQTRLLSNDLENNQEGLDKALKQERTEISNLDRGIDAPSPTPPQPGIGL